MNSTPSIGLRRRAWLAAMVSFAAPSAVMAADAVNVDGEGVALHGHDPVGYFEMGRPLQGLAKYSAKSRGARYWFANEANLQEFLANPNRFEPQYGGYCAYGVAHGSKPDIDPKAFAIVGGKLYLNLNPEIQKLWQTDIPGFIAKADKNWIRLKEK